MKRPIGIYFVMFWFWVAIYNQHFSPIIRVMLPQKFLLGQDVIAALQLVGVALLVVIAVGLFKLNRIARIVASFCFVIVVLYQSFALGTFFIYGPIDSKIILYKSFLLLPSMVCIYYLLNSKFRNYAKEFVKYHEQVAHQKSVKKRMGI